MNLEKEIICGYEVSDKMKRIWSIELDVLKTFVDVCNKFGLTYWIIGGTLLGAVRHKGFIPWDNDIDVGMPRRDFNKLLEIGENVFSQPFSFQSPVTEDGRYFTTYPKVRHSGSTGGSRDDYAKGLNVGVFIDIFCLDEVPNNKLTRYIFYRRLNEITKMQRFCFGLPLKKGFVNTIKQTLQRFVFNMVLHRPNASTLFNLYQKNAGKYQGKKCKQVAFLGMGCNEKVVWNCEDWDSSVVLDFEDMKLAAPKGYENILATEYGDYMKFPENKSSHEYLEFDPDIPFEKYFSEEFDLKRNSNRL